MLCAGDCGQVCGLKRSDASAEVLQQAGLQRATLEDLVLQSGMDDAAIAHLLQAMQARSRVIQPKALGVLGKAHLEQYLMRWRRAAPDTLTYHAQLSTRWRMAVCPGSCVRVADHDASARPSSDRSQLDAQPEGAVRLLAVARKPVSHR